MKAIIPVAGAGTNAALRGDGVASRREHLGDARRAQTGGTHSERGAQARAARAHNDHIMDMIDNLIGIGHGTISLRRRL